MKVVYADQKFDGGGSGFSIFLVGPTPRSISVPSWRPQALEILKKLNYNGIVLVPEGSTKIWANEYADQIEWEINGLDHCSLIAAWVPRKLPQMPAFTTNVEFGMYLDSGRLLYGRPNDAEKTDYLDYVYRKKTSFEPFDSLDALLARAVLESTLRK